MKNEHMLAKDGEVIRARCPSCTEEHLHEEKIGELAVCGHCGTIMRRDANRNLVALSREEWTSLTPDEQRRVLAQHDVVRLSAYGKFGGTET